MKTITRKRRAYTVVEMLIVVSLAATLAGLAFAPSGNVESTEGLVAGQHFSSMVEYAQSMAIARPDITYLIKVNQPANQFWLATSTTPDTPVTHPITKQPFRVTLGSGSPDGLTAVSVSGYSFGGDDVVKFDSTGAMDQAAAATISFAVGTASYTASADVLTGAVKVAQAGS